SASRQPSGTRTGSGAGVAGSGWACGPLRTQAVSTTNAEANHRMARHPIRHRAWRQLWPLVLPSAAMFTTKRVWTVLVTVAMVASPTWAQDDDDDLAPLAPLGPIGKPKTKAKPKPKPKPKATPKTKTKVVEEDDELAPIAPI